jgi:uncharacterized protein
MGAQGMSDTIKLASGRYFSFDNPEAFEYDAHELIHSLGMMCRFTGHTSRHYSVAQHSLLVSYLVPQEFALEGLAHDMHEALTNDIATPAKRRLPSYRMFEHRIERCVRRWFGLAAEVPQEVRDADHTALLLEHAELFKAMPEDREQWPDYPVINLGRLTSVVATLTHHMTPEMAAWRMSQRWDDLTRNSTT